MAEDAERWNANRQKYWEYFGSVEAQLPRRLVELHRMNTLHDGVVVFTRWSDAFRDFIVMIDGFRNGPVDGTDPFLFILHFQNVAAGIDPPKLPKESEILYVEIEYLGSGGCEFRAMLDEQDEWSIRFGGFDFYLHDYKRSDGQSGAAKEAPPRG